MLHKVEVKINDACGKDSSVEIDGMEIHARKIEIVCAVGELPVIAVYLPFDKADIKINNAELVEKSDTGG